MTGGHWDKPPPQAVINMSSFSSSVKSGFLLVVAVCFFFCDNILSLLNLSFGD
jgi:hypothetical protein